MWSSKWLIIKFKAHNINVFEKVSGTSRKFKYFPDKSNRNGERNGAEVERTG